MQEDLATNSTFIIRLCKGRISDAESESAIWQESESEKIGDSDSDPIKPNTTALVKKTQYSTEIFDSCVPLYFVQLYFTLSLASM